MATVIRPGRKGEKAPPKSKTRRIRRRTAIAFPDDRNLALSRTSSLDTLATRIPRRIRLLPTSGPRAAAKIGLELPEGTVVRLIVLSEGSDVIDTLIDGWLPAGMHELCHLCLPNGAYRLRLETPNAWHVAGIMIG